MKELINLFKRISNILIEIFITALNPFLLAVNDVLKVFTDTNRILDCKHRRERLLF